MNYWRIKLYLTVVDLEKLKGELLRALRTHQPALQLIRRVDELTTEVQELTKIVERR
jgi:hypothetical protein